MKLFVNKSNRKETASTHVVQQGKDAISVIGDVVNSHIGDKYIFNDPEPYLKKIIELTKSLKTVESEWTLLKENYNKLEIEYANLNNLSDYKQRALELRAEGKINEAIESVDTQVLDVEAANKHVFKAELLIENFQYADAEEHYKKSIDIFPSLEKFVAITKFYFNLSWFNNAKDYLNCYLQQKINPENRALIFYLIGTTYSSLNEPVNAEISYAEALKIYTNLEEKTKESTFQPHIAMSLCALGDILMKIHNQDIEAKKEYDAKAKDYYTKALEIYKNLAEKEPQTYLSDVAMTFERLGNVQKFIENKNAEQYYIESEKYYLNAIEKYESLFEPDSQKFKPDVATILIEFGDLQKEKIEYEMAEEYYTKALKIYKDLSEANPQEYCPHVATTLVKLGNLQQKNINFWKTYKYSDLGQVYYHKGQKFYTEALTIYTDLSKINPYFYKPDVANTYKELGNLHRERKVFTKAEESYNQAKCIYEVLSNQTPQVYLPKVAEILIEIAYNCQSDFYIPENKERFQEYVRKALNILEKCNDTQFVQHLRQNAVLVHVHEIIEKDEDSPNNIRQISAYPKTLEKYEKTLRIGYKKTLRIGRKRAKEKPKAYLLRVITILSNLAFLHFFIKKYPKAFNEYEEAMRNGKELEWREAFGKEWNKSWHSRNIDALKHIFKKTGNLSKEIPRTHLTIVASNLFYLASFHKAVNEYQIALREYEEALEINRMLAKEKKASGYFEDVAKTLNSLAILRTEINEYPKALEEYEEALEIYRGILVHKSNLFDERWQAAKRRTMNNFAIALNDFAYKCFEQSNFNEAEKCSLRCIEIREELTTEKPDTEASLVRDYGSLSWFYLFTLKYEESRQFANKALELDSSALWIKANFAHALLFQNRFSEAETIYKELAPINYSEKETFAISIQNDFEELEKASAIPETCKEDVKKIRKMLS